MKPAPRTVLVVDDDPQILRLLEQVLSPRGVKVVVVPRPSEALKVCERETVHLLISDMVMPEMDGGKLAERFLKIHPKASVLLISGYLRDATLTKSQQVRFLRKPFFPSDLIRQVQELLAES